MPYQFGMGEHLPLAVSIFDWLSGPFRAAWRQLRGRIVGPLQVIPDERNCFWHRAGQGMGLVARFHVTNSRPHPAVLVAARLCEPAVEGRITVLDDRRDGDRDSLLPHVHRVAQADFHINPAIRAAGSEDFIANVVIVDNFACEYRRRVVFRHS